MNNSPDNFTDTSPVSEEINADEALESDYRGLFQASNAADAALENVEEEIPEVDDEASEDTVDEELEDDTTGSADEDSVEAEDDEEDDVDEPAEDSTEREEVDVDSLDEYLFPHPDGSKKTWSQIQSELGQSNAASKKSREATQKLKDLDAVEAELAQQRELLNSQTAVKQLEPELAIRMSNVQQWQAQLDQAVQSNKGDEAALLREHINRTQNEIGQIQAYKEEVDRRAAAEVNNKAISILNEKGFGGIVGNKDFGDYAYNNLSSRAIAVVDSDAELAIMVEKARKWDNSQKKGLRAKKDKDSNQTTARSGGSTKPLTASQKKAKLDSKVKSGKATPEQMEAHSEASMRGLFRNQR